MRLTIDTEAGTLVEEGAAGRREMPLHSPDAFAAISTQWLAVGWSQKYSYGFTWMGRPVIQLPEDLVRVQELIFQLAPDVIVETGVAHGGSLVFYASLCRMMGKGRVIGIDIEIRPHNREAIEAHPLAGCITLVEGSSIDPVIVSEIKGMIRTDERVMVILDSNHTKAHVLAELRAYAPMVSVGSYLVAADGIMAMVADGPGAKPEWSWDNPREAAREFADANPDFEIVEPAFPFNEGKIEQCVTYWPGGLLRRNR